MNRLEELVVGRRGAELIVQLPTEQGYRERRMNTPVRLREADGTVVTSGALCLDRVDAKTLRRYINSREQRSTYLSWLALFMGALPIVEAREAADRGLIDRVSRLRPDLSGALPEAVTIDGRPARRGAPNIARRYSASNPPDLPGVCAMLV